MRRADRRGTSTRIPSSPKRPPAAHTAEQREQIERGLRILARMIAHAHLRREASRASQTQREPPPDQ